MKKLLPLGLSLVLIFGIIGCGKNKPTDENTITDEQAIEALVRSSAWFQSEKYQTANDSATQKGSKGDTIIDEPLWWRAIADTGRHWNINIKVTGDSAYVEWTLTSNGNFCIIGGKLVNIDSVTQDTVLFAGAKPLVDECRMDAVFKRTGDKNSSNKGWELKKVSGVAGYSTPTHTVSIDSIRIQCLTYPDTILNNALGYLFDTENAFNFAPGESISVTLYANTSDAKAYLHVWPWPFRIPMKNNGDGSYSNEQKWYIQAIPEIRFAWFDLVKKATINDTEYPYDYDGWLYPYLNTKTKGGE